MLQITTAQLNAMIVAWVFPMVRVFAFLAASPIFSNSGIPQRVKLIVGLAIGFAVASSLPPQNMSDPGSYVGIAILAEQMLIGAGLGFVMRVVFAAVDAAGSLIGLQMGLSFASFFDPQTQGQTAVIASIIGIIASLLFLSLNGHLLLINALANSFEWLPIAAQPIRADGWLMLARSGSLIFSIGLLLSLPVVAALLMTNIALAVLTRAAPQLNLFAVGFPITSTIGIAIIWLSLPTLAYVLEGVFDEGISNIAVIARNWVP
jgi:flagellar biosynthesis protein FliR